MFEAARSSCVSAVCLLSFVLSGCAEKTVLQQPGQNAACAAVARQRAADTRYDGFDQAMRQKVYDATYKDCMAWARRCDRVAKPTP